jgi:glutamate formiminotransferase
VLEAVPNVSEGRNPSVVAAVGDAFATNAALLDVHSDPDHHRSVFTLAGDDERIVESLLAGIAVATELVDLREHAGVHPRVGVVDVVPLVPLAPAEMPSAVLAAETLARRIGAELGLPVFRYGEIGGGKRPAFFRQGGLGELWRRVESGELEPDDGPHRIEPSTGAVLVGARPVLIAYNVDLATGDVAIAREVARSVRESSGGMLGVQAIGLLLPGSGYAQVSMNVIDVEQAPLHEVVARVRQEAEARGVEIRGGELVGLVPESVLCAATAAAVDIPGVSESRVLENVLRSRGLI